MNAQLTIASIICLLWPIAAAFVIRRDTASPAPILSMFVPLAISAAAMWFAVLQFVRVSPADSGRVPNKIAQGT